LRKYLLLTQSGHRLPFKGARGSSRALFESGKMTVLSRWVRCHRPERQRHRNPAAYCRRQDWI